MLCHHRVKFKNVKKNNYSWTPCQFFFFTRTRIEHNKICQKHEVWRQVKKKNYLCEISSFYSMHLQTNNYVYKSYFVQTIKTNKDILTITYVFKAVIRSFFKNILTKRKWKSIFPPFSTCYIILVLQFWWSYRILIIFFLVFKYSTSNYNVHTEQYLFFKKNLKSL